MDNKDINQHPEKPLKLFAEVYRAYLDEGYWVVVYKRVYPEDGEPEYDVRYFDRPQETIHPPRHPLP
jgi:hypothetical protein